MKNRIGFGTANLGATYGLIQNSSLSNPDSATGEASALLDEAFDNGLTILDTASHYGKSELIISEYLHANPKRHGWVISKFLPQTWAAETAMSAKLLGNNLKALLWHNFDEKNAHLTGLHKEFKTIYPDILLGCSTYGVGAAELALETGLFKVIEIEFNVLNPHVLNAIQAKANKNGVTLVLRSILQKGFLTDSFLNTDFSVFSEPMKNNTLQDIGTRLLGLARDHKMSVEELALRYAATVTEKEIILIGANAKNQLCQNIEILQKNSLSDKIVSDLLEILSHSDPKLFDLREWKN